MRTLSAAALIVIGGLVAGSCAGSGARKPRQSPATTEAPRAQAPSPAATPLGPRTPDASEQPAEPVPPAAQPSTAASTSGEQPPPAVAAEAARPARNAAPRAPSGAREDGRPNWWFAEPRIEGGMVQLCAEALGVDMAAARDEALSAARTRLRRELDLNEGAPIPGESIERAWVWPLPNSRVGPSRYAGYVWISAPKSGAQ